MKFQKLLIAVTMLLFMQPMFAQKTKDSWVKWKHLCGSWIGAENGQPGQGTGAFTFQSDLDSNILVRKSSTTFPASKSRPAFTHNDLLIVYRDTSGNPAKAIYFDNENHVLNYNITYNDSSIVMTSEILPNLSQFRLSYVTLSSKKVNVKFEIALPPDHSKFMIYLEGKALKKD